MFMTDIKDKMERLGFSRKVAVLLTKIERGIDSLAILQEQVKIQMAQYLSGQTEKKKEHDYYNPNPVWLAGLA